MKTDSLTVVHQPQRLCRYGDGNVNIFFSDDEWNVIGHALAEYMNHYGPTYTDEFKIRLEHKMHFSIQFFSDDEWNVIGHAIAEYMNHYGPTYTDEFKIELEHKMLQVRRLDTDHGSLSA